MQDLITLHFDLAFWSCTAIFKKKIDSENSCINCYNVGTKVVSFPYSRFPETPQAAVKQREEVPGPQPQARVRPWSAHPPAQGCPSRPNQLQADQLSPRVELNAISTMDQFNSGSYKTPASFALKRFCTRSVTTWKFYVLIYFLSENKIEIMLSNL